MTTTAAPAVPSEHLHDAYEALLHRCRALEPVVTAVAYPCEPTALTGVIEAAEAGLIAPILVGPRQKICAVAREARTERRVRIRSRTYPMPTPRQPRRSNWFARPAPRR